MKSKKSLYILVPAVIIVWALIIYKLLDFSGSDIVLENNTIILDTTIYLTETLEEIPFIAKYRDPFLGSYKSGNEPMKQSGSNNTPRKRYSSNNKQTQTVKKTYVNWPKIDYNGMIVSNENGDIVALININRKDYLMNKSDIIIECELIQIYSDSVKLKFKNEEKTFYK